MVEYTLGDALKVAFKSAYSKQGAKLASSFDDLKLTQEDFDAVQDLLPRDANWEQILEFAGRQKAILMRVPCDFTQNMYEEDFYIDN